MLTDPIVRAVMALRKAGHVVEPVSGTDGLFRVDGKDAVTGCVVLAMAIQLGLMGLPPQSR